ncbi:hypothetical protein [Burkholderia contaminans]|uniref:hypothetical protein n=2 Tax=Burkholderia contaminans TaxID=488447 RepID=UPI0015835B17|nr:hypothetical protein [Burkholderia contaminans]
MPLIARRRLPHPGRRANQEHLMQRLPMRPPPAVWCALSAGVLLIGLGACKRAMPPASPTADPASAVSLPAAHVPETAPASPLQTLLGVFGGTKPATWPAFDNLPGMQWSDAKPLRNPDSHSPEATHTRSGSTLLAGFGDVDVPDGKVGEDAGVKTDNEGHVGVVLNGNATAVLSIALRKFYPSDDTQDILLRQLGSRSTVRRIAGRCALDYGTTAPNTQNNVFFQVAIANAAVPVFAETYVDEEGGNQGPGATNFVFYRTRPDQRIASMKCKGAAA